MILPLTKKKWLFSELSEYSLAYILQVDGGKHFDDDDDLDDDDSDYDGTGKKKKRGR